MTLIMNEKKKDDLVNGANAAFEALRESLKELKRRNLVNESIDGTTALEIVQDMLNTQHLKFEQDLAEGIHEDIDEN